jgi:uncharacterized protein (DUF362 family)
MKAVYLRGLPPGPGPGVLAEAIRDLACEAAGDFPWLSKGETVLLKPALNSPDPYPSTTHPLAVSTMASLLAERGARVVIGDQSGIQYVLHHPGGVVRGSTRAQYSRSGMGNHNDSRFVSFEDDGWDAGFFHHRSPQTASWPDGYYITTWVQKADHIISLPRVSSHSQAGATLGLKSMVGLLREDSRMLFHANGPYNGFITRAAKGSTLFAADDGSGTFFGKIVEISDAIREKLRLTLYVATEVQATFGPDRYGIPIGSGGLGRARVVRPSPGLILASADQVAAEAAALAVLKDARRCLSFGPWLVQRAALAGNPYVRNIDRKRVSDHPYIQHGTKIGLGGMPGELVAEGVPGDVRERLEALLAA